MITSRNNIVGMDAAILMHSDIWKASGHVENFHDPLVDNKISKNPTLKLKISKHANDNTMKNIAIYCNIS